MQALAVVEAGDAIGHIKLGFRLVHIIALPGQLHFSIPEEAFSDGVIPAVAFAAHTGNEAMLD